MENQRLAERIFELNDQVVDLWTIRISAPELVAVRFTSLLAPDEEARAAKFLFDDLRRSFTISRGALRVLLGAYLGIAPSAVEFSHGSKGKPSLIGHVSLKFNASYSGAIAMFALTLGCEIGVDVEQIRPLQDMQDIASRFFHPDEAAELISVSAENRNRAFFLCWTRKEAYIKAIGEGLAVPLDNFRVTLRPGVAARFIHIAHDENAAEAWTLHNVETDPLYAAALAYRDKPRPIRVLPVVEAAELLEIDPPHPS